MITLTFKKTGHDERVILQLAEELPKSQKKHLQKALFLVIGAIKQEIQNWLSTTETRKTGRLINGWYPYIFETDSGKLTGGVTTDVPYALIHNDGGTITANGKKLTVPIPGSPAMNFAPGTRARDIPGLFVLKGKSQALLVRKLGDKIQPLYVLKSSVTIRPKHYIENAFETIQDVVVDEMTVKMVDDALKEVT